MAGYVALAETLIISILLTLAELARSFPGRSGEVLRRRWSWAAVALNCAAALILAALLIRAGLNPIASGLISPFAAFVLLRTDFTLLRSYTYIRAVKPLSLPLSSLWERAMRPIYDRIQLSSISSREKLIRALLYRYPLTEELAAEARKAVNEIQLYTRGQIDEINSFLDEIGRSETMTEAAKRVAYAKFILIYAGEEYARRLAERPRVKAEA